VAQDGQVLDVNDADALALAAIGWAIVGTVGPSNTRPKAPTAVSMTPPHLDTQVGSPQAPVHCFWDGRRWRDHTGAPT
jgi:hypothetical protein